jgi:CubicO group peptidase (beta-lactamase class C family)
MRRPGSIAAVFVVCAAAVAARPIPGPQLDLGTSALESYIELLRQQAGIPGISGVLLQEGRIVWERGLGMANLETRVRTTPDTPFYIADLSQMFSAVLLLQCVEQSHLDLDDPVSRYGVKLPDGGATLRQVLSHQAPAGSATAFKYDAERYSHLTSAVEYCVPQPYRKSIAHRLLERLAMIDSVPGRDMQNSAASPEGLFEPAALARYTSSLQRMAVPYKVDKRGRATRSDLPVDGINAATGLVSTVRDLAQFDKALDSRLLLREETLDAAWSPALAPNGTPLPMGLGWFVQTYRGTTVVWHFGVVPNAYSALVVKVPSRRATMILLANSDGLANNFQLEAGDVTHSPFASILLRMLL